MIVFEDKTFCTRKTCKNFNNGCDRTLTNEIIEAANKEKLFVAMMPFEKCYEPIGEVEDGKTEI